MAERPFRRALDKCRPGLSAVESMADLCHTSLTATAIRYAELTDDAIALIVSTGPTIDYCRLSETMKSLRELNWLRKGSAVPHKSMTARFNGDRDWILRAERAEDEIDIMDWLGGIRSVIATEEVVGLGRYGKR